ncbi:Endonuclease domain-containing 1 protein [Liparis tanakae]|uniref:Endonuclease domain-containing 1 protein n=1 Tax=Liparis tanakae TaxID=230148 RepID=A0A4Z2IUL1_9TELE|nr:Endonuclease domain-containing 1 protein [Liparis tanakae]
MPCPAAVRAAAAALWLLAALGPGLSLPAEDESEPGDSLCSRCFYRQTPPRGASAGLLCHSLPEGRAFATLSRPACGTAVFSAFHLRLGRAEEEGDELVTKEEGEEEEIIKVSAPALLRGGGDPSHPVSPTDCSLQHWDARVTTLVQTSISPRCSTLGGDLYILTGVGGLGAADECQTKPQWSAVCCAVPEGKRGFSLGLIRETGEGEREVSVKELEEILGAAELFSEGCGGADGASVGVRVGLHSDGLPGNIDRLDADLTGGNTGGEDGDSNTEGGEVGSGVTEGEEVGSGVTKGKEDGLGATEGEEIGSGASEGVEQRDVTRSRALRSGSSESSADQETVDEQETDTNSSSTLVYVLSTTLSILIAPLQPVFSTVTKLPGQVTYVLQEDLGVLSALPGETFSLVHLLTSDLLSWTGSAGETLLGIGGSCCSSIYYCSCSMLGALWNSCHTGVTGMGTLAGDTVGICGDALDNTWWVTKFFGGRLWNQSGGYVGSVVSEMGGQTMAVGGGLGRLVWRIGTGVGRVFRLGGGLIMGTVDVVFGAVKGAYEND